MPPLWVCVALVAFLLSLSQAIKAQRVIDSDKTQLNQSEMALRLEFSKSQYYQGESLSISVFLENTSQDKYYYTQHGYKLRFEGPGTIGCHPVGERGHDRLAVCHTL